MERGKPPLGDVNNESVALVCRVHQAANLLLAALAASNFVVLNGVAPRGTLLADAFVVVACLLDWWALRRFGFMRRSAVIIPIALCAAAVALVWFTSPDAWVWCMVGIVIAFVRLPIRLAIGVSITVWLIGVTAFVVQWHASLPAIVRVIQSGAFFIVLLALARRVSDSIVRRLRDTSVLLRDAIEAIGPGLAVMDRHGFVQLFNERATEVLDIPASWRDGRPIHVNDVTALQRQRGDLRLYDSVPDVKAMIEAGVSAIDPRLPDRYVRLDRSRRWIEVVTRRMASGSTVRTYSDVTPYLEAQRAAEQAAATRTTFLGHLSHEFRTPMSAVVGFTHLLLQDEAPGERRESLLGIQTAAQQLQQLADDMLDLASLEGGASSLHDDLFSLQELVERVAAGARVRLHERALEVTVDFAPDATRHFRGDPRRLERMLSTTLRNAEAMTEHGRIEIRVDVQSSDADAMLVRVAVRDTGRGIAPAERTVLLDRFAGDASSVGVADSGYIGLGLVRRYAEMMGGTIGIDGEYGHGTICWFTARLLRASDVASRIVRAPASREVKSLSAADSREPRVDDIPRWPARDEEPAADGAQLPAQAAMPVDANAEPNAESMPSTLVASLMQHVSGRHEDLDLLPYRTWYRALIVGACVFLTVALVNAWSLARTGALPIDGLVIMPLVSSMIMGIMAFRHRSLDGPFRRDSRLHLLLVLGIYFTSVRVNGILPVLILPAVTITLYLVQGRRIARMTCLALLGGTALLLWNTGVDVNQLMRLFAACVLSAVLMEWLIGNLFRFSETIERTLHTLRDLSKDLVNENARLEEAVRTADAAVQQRTDLMATVSHEIRTPMNAILGLSTLVASESLSPSQREWIERIRDNGHHLLRLVNNLLDLTRIDAGRATLDVATFDLEAVVSQVGDVLEHEGGGKGLRSSISVAPDVPRYLMGDRTRLTQLLLNFVANAIKYTEHGSVSVQVRRIATGTSHAGLRFDVVDTGVGMTKTQQARLFRRFEQLEASGRQREGAGLGLAICKWIAEAMRGRIDVVSERGRGSTFTFTVSLPLGVPPADAPTSTLLARSSEHLRGARVLVVDDHRINRQVAHQLLRRDGVVVYEAADGESALAAIRRWEPDLVLMDLQMPLLDGVEATRRLRQHDAYQRLPVIAMTAAVFSADQERCLAAGMNDFLPKPIDPDALRSMVVKWLPSTLAVPGQRVEAPVTFGMSPAQGERLQVLRGLAGLDVDAGLRRTAGDSDLYLSVLHSFVKGHADAAHRARQSLLKHDRAQARRIVHALCGVAGTVGGTCIHAAACAFEERFDAGADDAELESLLAGLSTQLEELVAALNISLEAHVAG